MNENFTSKKQEAQEELGFNEEKYSNILKNINSIIYYTNEKGIITFISKSVFNVFGYEQDQVLGKHFMDFVPSEDSHKAENSFARLAIEKKHIEELHIISKDGTSKLVKLIHLAIFEVSRFAGEMGIVIDISANQRQKYSLGFQTDLLNSVRDAISTFYLDRNIANSVPGINYNQELIENTLLAVEDGMHEILDKSPLIFYTHTPDYIINFVSTHSKKLLGFDPEEVKTRFTELLTNNPINKRALELTKIAIDTGVPQEPYEVELTNNKNGITWFEVHEIPIVKEGKTVLIIGSLTDITARKKAEEELHASQLLLINALEMASMGHWEYNVSTDSFTFNDQFYKMLHTSIKEVGSYTMSSTEYAKRFFHPDDYELIVKEIQDSIKTADANYHREFEHRIIFADGEVGTIAVRFNIIKDLNGNTIKTHGVNQDITKYKSIQNELIKAKLRAEESSRLKSVFLANMSHELRTPMVGVLGFAELLLDELSEPSQVEMVTTIINSGKRLMTTLNLILDLSRIEANKQEIKYSLINLNNLIKEVIEQHLPLLKRKKIYLHFTAPNQTVYLKSDADILFKILNNLIDNAVKFTHHGGIIVNTSLQSNGSAHKVLIEIADTGIGIPPKYQKVIFEPFRQVSEGFTRKFEGTGLGLSITKKFIELLNGSITLKSEPGQGSTFIVSFPYSNIVDNIAAHTANNSNNIILKNSTLDDKTILLVEDDSSNALVIYTYLKYYVKIDHVSDGKAAINICSSHKYDAILMDINLKEIDGVETLKEIRKLNEHYLNIPIIAITAYALHGDKEKFMSFGFTNYLSKPFGRSQLLLLLNETLKKDQ